MTPKGGGDVRAGILVMMILAILGVLIGGIALFHVGVLTARFDEHERDSHEIRCDNNPERMRTPCDTMQWTPP